jgi:transposase
VKQDDLGDDRRTEYVDTVVREAKERGVFRRRFEVLRIDDLALIRFASTPALLRDFGRWQDAAWRRDTLAMH